MKRKKYTPSGLYCSYSLCLIYKSERDFSPSSVESETEGSALAEDVNLRTEEWFPAFFNVGDFDLLVWF